MVFIPQSILQLRLDSVIQKKAVKGGNLFIQTMKIKKTVFSTPLW